MSWRLRFIFIGIIMLGALAALSQGQSRSESTLAVLVAEADSVKSSLPWLHVEVETSYGWFWQKSTGRAYTTISRESKQRVKVGKLCVRLMAHDTTTHCLENADSIVVFEQKKGVAIPKRTAFVSAWTEDPRLDTLTVQMAP